MQQTAVVVEHLLVYEPQTPPSVTTVETTEWDHLTVTQSHSPTHP